jgi:hypothetical protein
MSATSRPGQGLQETVHAVSWNFGQASSFATSANLEVRTTQDLVLLAISDRGFGFSLLLNPEEASRLASLLHDRARKVRSGKEDGC